MKRIVLHVISDLDIGGTERSLVKLLPHLQREFDNHVVCLVGRGRVGTDLVESGIRVHYLNGEGVSDMRIASRLSDLFSRLHPSLAVTYLVHADLVGRFVARRHGVPVVSAQRSSLYKRGWLRLPERLTSSLVSGYVVQTEAARSWVHSKNVAVIPNAVDVPATARHTSDSPQPTPLKIVCVSNLRHGKGHETLLKAVSVLPSKAYQLLLVGDGAERPSLEKLISQLSLADTVQLLGSRRDVEAILTASDLFVLPSHAEGMSNALLEAMALGLPCVASDIPANRAVIQDGKTGVLFHTGDANNLATQLSTLLEDPVRRQNIGLAAEAYIRTHHAPEHIAEQWEKVIRDHIVS